MYMYMYMHTSRNYVWAGQPQEIMEIAIYAYTNYQIKIYKLPCSY